jgi:hypothetical protein
MVECLNFYAWPCGTEGSNVRSTSPALLVCHEGVRGGSQLSGTTSGENLLRFKGMQMQELASLPLTLISCGTLKESRHLPDF